jgi:predicted enzyme related to lactoylglutathione lyase
MHIQFAELAVRDQERAKRFYVNHFGCEVAADTPTASDGWRWIELKFAGAKTTLHLVRRTEEGASDAPLLVLVDDDVAVTIERLRSRHVEILKEPHQPPWQPTRTMAEFRDSEGNRMVVSSR